MKSVALFLLALLSCSVAYGEPLVEHLDKISVTVKTSLGEGSGTLFVRKSGDDTITYVWTAAHVIKSERKTHDVVDDTGTIQKVVEFDDVVIAQEMNQDGKGIGDLRAKAEVIRYSDAEEGEDIALLKVRKNNFAPESQSATFVAEDFVPQAGTELLHVGSLWGSVGANSLTSGILSRAGRMHPFNGKSVLFDQTTVTAFPGCSGGGVFLKQNGAYVGMLTRVLDKQFNFIVPARRMRTWAKRAGVEFAMDRSIPMPSLEELRKMPVEDGVTAATSEVAEEVPPPPAE